MRPACSASAIVGAALAIGFAGARDHAGSWNDGSRLAAVESLVDRGTWAIDDSIFIGPHDPSPYPPDDPVLRDHGTKDKLRIGGRWYSDKPPVPALLTAGLYKGLQATTGLIARERPADFCFWMAFLTAGLPYAAAVTCMHRIGSAAGPRGRWGLALTAAFGLASVALPYSRQVNAHILLTAVAAAVLLHWLRFAEALAAGRRPLWRAAALGTLAGFGYTVDLGAGPMLFLCTAGLIAARGRSPACTAAFLAGAVPWIALHHALNFALAGTLGPANAVPEYLAWPGSPFSPADMTGVWSHPGLGKFALYAGDLLFGKRGFFGHNLPLFAVIPGIVVLLRRRLPERAELAFCLCWFLGTWLLYAAASKNLSGLCCSVRWFVPLTVPGFYVLAVMIRRLPAMRAPAAALIGWGLIVGALMWWYGPWMTHMVPGFWFLQAGALATAAAFLPRRRPAPNPVPGDGCRGHR